MARNEEKSHSMLNRWLASKAQKEGVRSKAGGAIMSSHEKRPAHTNMVNTVHECEKWRGEVIREIGRGIVQIQATGLPDKRLRELNDSINKLVREKHWWERRILDLGGPNYAAQAKANSEEVGGTAMLGGTGSQYKYFGEARNLAGVKEMFNRKKEEERARELAKQAKADFRGLDSDYYGFRDEEDGKLEPLEAEVEKELLAEAAEEWAGKKLPEGAAAWAAADDLQPEVTGMAAVKLELPSKDDIEAALLERRKEELKQRYLENPAALAELIQLQKERDRQRQRRQEQDEAGAAAASSSSSSSSSAAAGGDEATDSRKRTHDEASSV